MRICHWFIWISGLSPFQLAGQGTGISLLNISFGEGSSNPGYLLTGAYTAFQFTPDSCPAYGQYTLTNNLYRCPATRMGRSLDNTPNSRNGYMMLFNTAGDNSRLVFSDTLHADFCPGSGYRFSAYFLNAAVPANCSLPEPLFPSFSLTAATTDGRLLGETVTGQLRYAYNMDRTPQFKKFSVDFTIPPGTVDLVLSIRNVSTGGAQCSFPVALDDIQLVTTGPDAGIRFADAGALETTRHVCFRDSVTLTFLGSLSYAYNPTRYQWQQSTDSGSSWHDIPGAVNPDLSRRFTEPDTFLIRLTAAEGDRISNVFCRVASNSLRVEVDGPPENISVSSNAPLCAGGTLELEASGGQYYTWYGPNGYYNNIPRPRIYRATAAHSGMYSVTISSAGGCPGFDSVYVQVHGVEAVAGPDTLVCTGDQVDLFTVPGKSWQWSPAAGLSSPAVRNPVATVSGPVLYTVTVTDESGCRDTASVQIRVRNAAEVKALTNGLPYLCRPYDSLLLFNASTGEGLSSLWDFGNGTVSRAFQPPVQYLTIPDTRNNYLVQLLVTDSAGCSDTAAYRVQVVSNCYIAVPGAFTPNGDGLNDELGPLNAYKVTDLEFRIYNRKGIRVFETRNWQQKWDGTWRGEPQDPGVYTWTLRYRNEAGTWLQFRGTTVLIR